ncbi:MAG: DUF86 domain-containing protein [Firmicutes bacterium]|nr:DUF86 domain-containing protein [Candidatus Colimorpha enterica]
MAERDKSVLMHIADHCEDIGGFIERFGNDFGVFVKDRAYFNAVSMCILQIGELSGALSEEYRAATSERIPWQNIRGMRNLVAHAYGSLDEELVWETATDDIPALLGFCREEIEKMI